MKYFFFVSPWSPPQHQLGESSLEGHQSRYLHIFSLLLFTSHLHSLSIKIRSNSERVSHDTAKEFQHVRSTTEPGVAGNHSNSTTYQYGKGQRIHIYLCIRMIWKYLDWRNCQSGFSDWSSWMIPDTPPRQQPTCARNSWKIYPGAGLNEIKVSGEFLATDWLGNSVIVDWFKHLGSLGNL